MTDFQIGDGNVFNEFFLRFTYLGERGEAGLLAERVRDLAVAVAAVRLAVVAGVGNCRSITWAGFWGAVIRRFAPEHEATGFVQYGRLR